MLNLRELIFASPSSSFSPSSSTSPVHNDNGKDNNDADENDDDESDCDGKGDGAKTRKKKRRRQNKLQKMKRYVASDPMPSAVYTTHPEVIHYRTWHRTTRDPAVVHPEVLQYAPGMASFLRFRQADANPSELATKRKILRAVFNECFYGRDYPGAYDALRTLADVDAIDRPELERLVEMLRHATDAPHWLKLLLTKVTAMKTIRTWDPAYMSTFIQTFVEVAVADGDIAVAQEVLRDRLADVAYARSPTLIAYHALLLVAEAVTFVAARWPAFERLGGDIELVTLAQVRINLSVPGSHLYLASAPVDTH